MQNRPTVELPIAELDSKGNDIGHQTWEMNTITMARCGVIGSSLCS